MAEPLEGNDVTERTCVIDGCDKPPRTARADYCKMHYHRLYRHGSVDMVATSIRTGNGRRYRRVHCPGHPMAQASGYGYTHRVVLYDEIGPGPHECYWCGTSVDWMPHRAPNALEPDHVNGMGDDNRIENLVPSCPRCNAGRGSQHRATVLRAAGFWAVNDTVGKLSTGRTAPIVQGVAS